MRLPRPTARTAVAVLAFDALALGVWWYLIPGVKRPGDVLFAMLAVLGALTAVFATNRVVQAVALTAASLGVAMFGVEMAEKYGNLIARFQRPAAGWVVGEKDSPYSFNPMDAETYVAARARAIRDGVPRSDIEPDYAGDIFAGVDPTTLVVQGNTIGGRVEASVSRGLSMYLAETPLGVELRPDFVWRLHAEAAKSGEKLYDGVATSDRYGDRTTGGDGDAEDVRIFMGCSFTYGLCVSDHEAIPEIYSRLHGYRKRVLNFGIAGAGPHHALRDLELDRRAGRAGVDPAKVKAVYFGYISDHARRVVTNHTSSAWSPRYVLENGRAVYKGDFRGEEKGRLALLWSRMRVLPALLERTASVDNAGSEPLALAILEKMHALCRERYDVPLHVIFWSGSDELRRGLLAAGMTVTAVADVFGPDEEECPVKYSLADGHPAPHAYRLVARRLYELDAE